jgi:hypothetical protein
MSQDCEDSRWLYVEEISLKQQEFIDTLRASHSDISSPQPINEEDTENKIYYTEDNNSLHPSKLEREEEETPNVSDNLNTNEKKQESSPKIDEIKKNETQSSSLLSETEKEEGEEEGNKGEVVKKIKLDFQEISKLKKSEKKSGLKLFSTKSDTIVWVDQKLSFGYNKSLQHSVGKKNLNNLKKKGPFQLGTIQTFERKGSGSYVIFMICKDVTNSCSKSDVQSCIEKLVDFCEEKNRTKLISPSLVERTLDTNWVIETLFNQCSNQLKDSSLFFTKNGIEL